MPSTDRSPFLLDAVTLARRLREGALSAEEALEATLARIAALEPRLRAWVHLDADGARAAARACDAAAAAGRSLGPLHGVPVGVKDIFDVAGMPTRANARPYFHRQPKTDAASVARLRRAGAIVLGKTATTQFAYRDPAETRNPWNPEHTPGGSSSGSGAAVAARMVPLALGTQTVGSVLRPAAYCGVVGLKPTHGLVPAEGVIPLAWSLDHVGVLARTVADAAHALGVMIEREVAPAAVSAPRIALAPALLERATPDVAAHVEAVAQRLARAGAAVARVDLPAEFARVHAAGQTVLEVEAAAYHQADHATHADEFGGEIRKLIETGLAHAATAYVHADRARLAFRHAVRPLLEAHDALLSPTAPAPAPAGLAWTGDASLCAPWSFAGVPSISLPSGLTAAGLPLAVQLTQAPDGEARLLGVAAWCERVLAFADRPRD